MQKLEIFQSLWAMELRRPDGVERTHEEAVEMVAAAGYAGMGLDMGIFDDDKNRRTKPLFQQHELGCLINAFPKSIEDLRPVLRMAKEFDARFVNVIGQVMPISLEGISF